MMCVLYYEALRAQLVADVLFIRGVDGEQVRDCPHFVSLALVGMSGVENWERGRCPGCTFCDNGACHKVVINLSEWILSVA
jgi:hypothetical protein